MIDKNLNSLTAISPLDGRYSYKTTALRPIFSEYGLIKQRLRIEIEWLKFLLNQEIVIKKNKLSKDATQYLDNILAKFDVATAATVKDIESTTNHDIKAVEYFLKQQLQQHDELAKHIELVHFGCTSEDINNLSYALMLLQARDNHLLPALQQVQQKIAQFAKSYATTPMLARTHGQPASPTTVGKEFANYYHRLQAQIDLLLTIKITGKFNGAVGNFNAHVAAQPKQNWVKISKQFITSLGITPNMHTTQIEPHDNLATMLQQLSLINTILIDLSRDVWGYISLNYFQQVAKSTETGSSTMPHKVNPIDFENAEGNLGMANAISYHLAQKLPISRWQRDLSDSTVIRNLGVAFAYAHIAYQSLMKGLNKLAINNNTLKKDLQDNPAVLAEALQTIMRINHISEPYEKLKKLTRGKTLTIEVLHDFVETLDLPPEVKQQMQQLTPEAYCGLAAELAVLDIE